MLIHVDRFIQICHYYILKVVYVSFDTPLDVSFKLKMSLDFNTALEFEKEERKGMRILKKNSKCAPEYLDEKREMIRRENFF